MDIDQLLKKTVVMSGSDLHLGSGALPQIRVDGQLQPMADKPITAQALTRVITTLLEKRQINTLDKELDLAYSIAGVARFRVNIFNQLKGPSIVFRVIPEKIKTLAALDLPEVLSDFCGFDSGLVLITGPTGSGKSTTLAVMIDHINWNQAKHILTVEDPIEFVHENVKCLIQQREVYRHTQSFHSALRAALREDPDVILLGELRDRETIRLALTAAQTGHLVFATLHTSSAAKTISRMIDVFAAEEKTIVRTLLSESLQTVVAQVLLKRKGGGRVAAHEIMVCTPAVRNLIRENKIHQIPAVLQTGGSYAMMALDQYIERLKLQSVID